MVFGPGALLQGGALEVDHHTTRGAVQELTLTLVGPRIDQSIQGERAFTVRKDEVQGKLSPLLCVPSLTAMEETPSKEGAAGVGPQGVKEIHRVSLLVLVKLRPDVLHALETGEELWFIIGQMLTHRLGGVAPGLGDIIRKGPCPAPASPWCIAIAKVPGIVQDASEALRDDKDVCHGVFHFPRNTEMALNEILHPLQVHEKLMPTWQSGVPAIALTRSAQVVAT